VRATAKGAAVALALFFGTFLFRIGFLLPIIMFAGVITSIAITLKDQRVSKLGGVVAIIAVVAYATVAVLLFVLLTNQLSRRTFEMTWEDGPGKQRGESEVVLEFAQFPGNRIGIYSNELREHLLGTRNVRTEVEFEVVSDLWCVRGFHEVRIGDLTDLSKLSRVGGYSRGAGNRVSPWGRRPFWCSR
jgi:hypothetical protein